MAAATTPISTYQAYLLKGTTEGSTTTYEKLIDIKDFPDLGGSPEQLETTTLSDNMSTYILGIQKLDALEFSANYKNADYTTLKALQDAGAELDFQVALGKTVSSGTTTYGVNGLFSFKGLLSVFVSGGGVNEVVGMKITIAPTTVITFSTPA